MRTLPWAFILIFLIIVISAALTHAYTVTSNSYETQLSTRQANPLADALAGPTCDGDSSLMYSELEYAASGLRTICGDAGGGNDFCSDPAPDKARVHAQKARQLLAPHLAADASLPDYDDELASLVQDILPDSADLPAELGASLSRVRALQQKLKEHCAALHGGADAAALAALQNAQRTRDWLLCGNFAWYWGLVCLAGALWGLKRLRSGNRHGQDQGG